MEKKTVSKEEMENTIRKSFSMSQAESSSEQTVAEFRAKGMKIIQEQKHNKKQSMPRQPSLYCMQGMQLFNDASVPR